MKALRFSLTVVVLVTGWLTGPVRAQHEYAKYKPLQVSTAENHIGVKFLPAERDWERLDIYVPKDAKEEKLPCIVWFYGGGWGGKVIGDGKNFKALVDAGYVVAMPDYVLGAQQPVPLAVWDGAAAIRYLRANAAQYKIDPERIAMLGVSAGGWLAQHLAPSDSQTLVQQGNVRRGEPISFIPMLEPHPAHAEMSAQVCAFVTDWGAGTLGTKRPGWLGPNDPPLFTCGAMPETFVPKGVAAYREAGAIAELGTVYGKDKDGKPITEVKNPHDYGHCLVGVTETRMFTKDKTGNEVTFGQRTMQFLDEYVKNPQTASAPEIFPAGGPVFGSVPVTLRTIHADGAIHYTLDGTEPTARSPRYDRPVSVTGGVTLKAVAVKTGRKPSPVTAVAFTPSPFAPPVITTTQQVYRAKLNQPFAVTMQARCEKPVTWGLSGKVLAQALEAVDTNKDSSGIKRAAPWLALDPKTGVLAGTPTSAGVSVFIVAAAVTDGQTAQCDARNLIVVTEP
jgi:hypothetical protein